MSAALLASAFSGMDWSRAMDCHVHLLGLGDDGSGIRIHPDMKNPFHLKAFLSFKAYLHASRPTPGLSVDQGFVTRLTALLQAFPPGMRLLLLAFEQYHDSRGDPDPSRTGFHVPNSHAASLARLFPHSFSWAASIHPHRADAVDKLEEAFLMGAVAIKWLPQAMGIDPASPRCDRFYQTLVRLGLPLLCHAGHERAVMHGGPQTLGNPLRLRRPLDAGVTVVIAHAATLGFGHDLDHSPQGPLLPNFDLFLRLLDQESYQGRLFGDLSAVLMANRSLRPLITLLSEPRYHSRLLNGSDYPLPGLPFLFPVGRLARAGLLTPEKEALLRSTRSQNPLLFDFLLKRLLEWRGVGFPASVFETARVFADRATH